jgi:hypothetical protein
MGTSPHPGARGPVSLRPLGLVVLAAVLAGCTAGSSATAGPATTGAASAAASAVASVGPVSTTVTSWGTILDRPPATFPRYPGAVDANGATSDPVTQSLSTGASVATVSAWYAYALPPARFQQTSVSDPAEDGSVTAEFDGSSLGAGCRARLTFRPQGTLTFILALISAACPAS